MSEFVSAENANATIDPEEEYLKREKEMIALFLSRDERAISMAQEEYGSLILSIARNALGDSIECEECKSDTLLALWNNIPPDIPDSLRAYTAHIARCCAIDRYKIASAKKRIPSEVTDCIDELEQVIASPSAEEDYESAQLGAAINSFVSALDEDKRYIFLERFYFGESVGYIAKSLSLTSSAVYKELDAIKKKMKDYLKKEGVIV